MRLIPACAGNTAAYSGRAGREGAHPRLRGEHSMTFVTRIHYSGSSPPARGTRLHELRACCRRRLIPACAGNTALFGIP